MCRVRFRQPTSELLRGVDRFFHGYLVRRGDLLDFVNEHPTNADLNRGKHGDNEKKRFHGILFQLKAGRQALAGMDVTREVLACR